MKKRPMSRHAISTLGGQARAKKLSASRRKAIARKAALARWNRVVQDAFQYVGPDVVVLRGALPRPPVSPSEDSR